jgi:hypothetical protein
MAPVVMRVDHNIMFIFTLPVLLCTVSSSVDSSCITFSYYKIEFPYLSPHLKLCVQELFVSFCLSPYRILCSAYNRSLAIIIKLKSFAGLCVVLCNKKIKHVARCFKTCYLTKSLRGALRSYYLLRWSTNSPSAMWPEGLLPLSQELATSFCLRVDESSPILRPYIF